jgi:exodeoxyribonuclease VII small subunit
MTADPKQFNFAGSIKQLEEINAWFQNEDLDLDEGLRKLKTGKDLIKKCRARLSEVENEFVDIKKEFAQDEQAGDQALAEPDDTAAGDGSGIPF